MGYTVKFQKPASYQNQKYGGGTIGSSGCGPSALCNALANAGIANVSVPTMCALAVSCGARVDGGTVEETLLRAASKKYGFTYRSTSKNAELMRHLKAGGTAICWCGGGYPLFSNGGHFVAAVGLDRGGLVYVADSLYYGGKWSYNGTRKSQIKTTGTTGLVRCTITALGKATADRSPSYYLIFKAGSSQKNADGKDVEDMTEKEVRALIDKAAEEKAKQAVSNWAADAWNAAKKAGVLDGTAPQGNLTREQYAVSLAALGLISGGDTPSEWAESAFQAATNAGVLDGTNPRGMMTREMYAVTLVKLGLVGAAGKDAGTEQTE